MRLSSGRSGGKAGLQGARSCTLFLSTLELQGSLSLHPCEPSLGVLRLLLEMLTSAQNRAPAKDGAHGRSQRRKLE